MKKTLLFLSFFIIFFAGCSQKSSVLSLNPYTSNSHKIGYERHISINSITDQRSNKSVIATITDSSGNVDEFVVLQNDLTQWVKNGLVLELNRLGATLDGYASDMIVDVAILELKANLTGYSSDNLKGSVKMQITIRQGDKTITKNVTQDQSKFAPIRTGGAFKSFFDELMNDIIKRVALQIIKS